MPELPEAETLRRQLRRTVRDAIIERAQVHHARMTRNQPRSASLAALTRGRRVTDIQRHGKAVVLTFDPPATIVIRLGMSGQIRLADGADPIGPYTRVRFRLTDGRELRLVDMRMFGEVLAYPTADLAAVPAIALLGPEPLAGAFAPAVLARVLDGRRAPLVSLLMNQHLLAGIGKIYADEVCFTAGVHPLRPGGDLRAGEVEALHTALRTVLPEAIRHRGTSIRDGLYVDLFGRHGAHQRHLRVYARGGHPCRRCGAPIVRLRHQARSVYHCARCQR